MVKALELHPNQGKCFLPYFYQEFIYNTRKYSNQKFGQSSYKGLLDTSAWVSDRMQQNESQTLQSMVDGSQEHHQSKAYQ